MQVIGQLEAPADLYPEETPVPIEQETLKKGKLSLSTSWRHIGK